MKWYAIKIKTTPIGLDAISDILVSIGANGVEINNPNEFIIESQKPNVGDYIDESLINMDLSDVYVKAYFNEQTNISELKSIIEEKVKYTSQYIEIGSIDIEISSVDDEDWANSWKKYYKPLPITNNIIIKPTWEEYVKKDNEIIVEMDPGMAFGTGTHETTKMCAQLIEKYLNTDDNVIDVGCGSGILSIIAAKLGAKSVISIDIDDVAVRVAKENCRLNSVEDNVTCFTGKLTDIQEYNKKDIIVANIIANVIIEISHFIREYIKENGYFIASGIIRERKDEVCDAYSEKGFIKVEEIELGEWVAIAFKCQDFS